MKVHVYDDTFSGEAEAQLTDFHNSVKEAPFFQSVGFFNATSGNRNYRPVFFVITDDADKLIGSLLAHHISILPFAYRFTSFTLLVGEPVLEHNVDKNIILGLFLSELKKHFSGKSLFIEFRNLNDLSQFDEIFNKNGFQFENWLNSEISTADFSTMLGNVTRNKQKQITEAETLGIITRPASNAKEVDIFYRQLKRFYLFSLHRPLPPKKVFMNLYSQALSKNSIIPVIITLNNGRIIGGMVCPYDSSRMYEWYICNSYKNKSDQLAGVATTWGGLKYAFESGLGLFNFMGLGKPEKEYGVRRFKRQFGGNENNFGRYIYRTSKHLSKTL